jgi:hypothetical protein
MTTPRDLLEAAGVEVASQNDTHFRLGWCNTRCPYCHGSSFHLGIANNFSRANCYKCGKKDPIHALHLLTNVSFDSLKTYRVFAPREEIKKTYGKYTPPPGLVPLSPKDRKYLLGRGLDADRLETDYGLQSVGPFSGLPKGIFIPITHQGRPVSWQIRFREPEDGQRYKTAKDSEKSVSEKDILFGAEHCLHTIIAVEGFFDKANIGFGAACLFGLAYSRQQVLLLARFPRRILCFDNSTDAQQVASRLADELAVFPGETLRVCLDADDPGSASRAEVEELRRFAGLPTC